MRDPTGLLHTRGRSRRSVSIVLRFMHFLAAVGGAPCKSPAHFGLEVRDDHPVNLVLG